MNKEEFLNCIGDRKMLYLDFETTGLYALEKYSPAYIEERDWHGNIISKVKKEEYEYDDIIEIGYILVDPKTYQTIASGEYLIKPDKKISETILQVTGITQEMVDRDGVSKKELYEIMEPILDENPVILAYNAKFDITFMYKWLHEMDEVKYKYFNFDVIDVMTIYANYYPYDKDVEIVESYNGEIKEKNYGHRLVAAVRTLCNRDLKQTHRALDDIEETIIVFKELESRFNVYDFVNVLGYHVAKRERRYFYSLKPYHACILPLTYDGGKYLEKLRANEDVKSYHGYYIPKWVLKEQNWTPNLRENYFSNTKNWR